MNVLECMQTAASKVRTHSPELLLIGGTVGLIATVALTFKQSSKIKSRFEQAKEDIRGNDEVSKPAKALHVVKKVAPATIPIVLACAGTLTCFYSADRIRFSRGVQLANAYSLLSTAANSYIDKVEEKLSEEDLASIHEELARDIDFPENDFIIEDGEGDTLVYDYVTGRYFKSTLAKIREAEAAVATRLIDEMTVPLNYFYEVLGLFDCSYIGEAIGWSIDGVKLKVCFNSMLDERTRPCLVLRYRTEVIDKDMLHGRNGWGV